MEVITQTDHLPPHHAILSSASPGWRNLSLTGDARNYALVLVQWIDSESKIPLPITENEVNDISWLKENPSARAVVFLVCTAQLLEKNKPALAEIIQVTNEKLPSLILKRRTLTATASLIASIKEMDEELAISKEDETAAIRQFDIIAQMAIDKKASDIHYEIYDTRASVFFRIDGLLQKHIDLGAKEARTLVRSAYNTLVEAGSTRDDFNERKPQNAVIDRQYAVGQVRLRFASMPVTPKGVNVVLRILLTGVEQKHQSFLELGYHPSQANEIARAFGRASGVTIIAGTTGSGKSTTLKNAIEGLIKERPSSKFRTLEDPVEYRISGASQTSIVRDDKDSDNSKPFTDALKACLRTDPDFIMIGEVRDKTTAIMAMQAAQTGHQVATTLHTESWSGILNRLVVIGLDFPTIAQPGLLSGLIYQKLVPVLCPKCKVPLSDLKEDDSNQGLLHRVRHSVRADVISNIMTKGAGCPHCSGRGTIGRTICAETAVMTRKILRHVANGDVFAAIGEWQSERNDQDMRGRWASEHALHKMNQGLVSPFDVETLFKYIDEIVEEGAN